MGGYQNSIASENDKLCRYGSGFDPNNMKDVFKTNQRHLLLSENIEYKMEQIHQLKKKTEETQPLGIGTY